MKTFVSNSTFGRESLSPTSIKPFASARLGAKVESGSPHWTISATVDVGLRPVKDDENRCEPQCVGSGEIEPTSGAVEAEQLCGPERA